MKSLKFHILLLFVGIPIGIVSCSKKSVNKKIEGTHLERQSDNSGDQGLAQGMTPQLKNQILQSRTQLDECLKLNALQLYEVKAFVECTTTGLLVSTQVASIAGEKELSEGLKKLDSKGWTASQTIMTRLALIKEIMSTQESLDKTSLNLLYERLSTKIFSMENSSVATTDDLMTNLESSKTQLEASENHEALHEGSEQNLVEEKLAALSDLKKSNVEKLNFLNLSPFEKEMVETLQKMKSADETSSKAAKESLLKTVKALVTEEYELQKGLVEKTNQAVQAYNTNLNVIERNELKDQLIDVGYSLKLKGITQKIFQGNSQLLEIFDRVQKVLGIVQK